MTEVAHNCTPDQWCALCDHNRRCRGESVSRRPAKPGVRPAAKVVRPLPCVHLGIRTEYRPGCGGRMCRHRCEKGRPEAVPGGVCQTCPDYEAEG